MQSNSIVLLDRHLGLGASDAKRIVDGDWHKLYMEKTQQADPEDLSYVFRVQLGSYTEPFHLLWLSQMHDFVLDDRSERIYHPEHEFMFCHLDGWRQDEDTFIEVKHSNSRATARDKALYYMPQLQHQLACTGKSHCYFSVIAGNDEPEMLRVDRNQDLIDELIKQETAFWWHVENKVAPDIIPTGKQAEIMRLVPKTLVGGLQSYDMLGNNEWADAAADYLTHANAAAAYEGAKDKLKTLVPTDASDAVGYGIIIKRDKRGSLRITREDL